jgi:hypothetical protein
LGEPKPYSGLARIPAGEGLWVGQMKGKRERDRRMEEEG